LRVALFGAPCSGKSTFAVVLGEACEVPVTHLDDIFHRPGWEPTPVQEFQREVEAVADTDAWVIDGNYGRVRSIVLARATHVVAFDLPLRALLWRIVYRTLGRRLGWRGATRRAAQVQDEREPTFAVLGMCHAAGGYKRGHLRQILKQVADAGLSGDRVHVIQKPGDVILVFSFHDGMFSMACRHHG
jgi:hypothetical protein